MSGRHGCVRRGGIVGSADRRYGVEVHQSEPLARAGADRPHQSHEIDAEIGAVGGGAAEFAVTA